MSTSRSAGAAALLALVLSTGSAAPALASSTDWDSDGMSNTWETTYRLDPKRAGDAKADADRDGLTHLREHQLRTLPRDEDTDDDGQDDGDEIGTRTKVKDADSDDDGRKDGDEDHDRDGEDDEDEGDRYGEIVSYDAATGILGVTSRSGLTYSFRLAADVEVEFEDAEGVDCPAPVSGGTSDTSDEDGQDGEDGDDERDERDEDEGSVADLRPGLLVAEIDVERGVVEEIELLRTAC